jgi:pentatricopeptide repeat protein
MEAEKINVPIGYLAMMVDMYCQAEDVDKAYGLYQEFLQMDPSASMDAPKVIRLANLLVSNDRVQGRQLVFSFFVPTSSPCWPALV